MKVKIPSLPFADIYSVRQLNFLHKNIHLMYKIATALEKKEIKDLRKSKYARIGLKKEQLKPYTLWWIHKIIANEYYKRGYNHASDLVKPNKKDRIYFYEKEVINDMKSFWNRQVESGEYNISRDHLIKSCYKFWKQCLVSGDKGNWLLYKRKNK